MRRFRKWAQALIVMFAVPSGLLLMFDYPAVAQQVYYRQPNLDRVAGHFCVQCNMAAGEFHLVQWEPNPYLPNGQDVAASWQIGRFTGLYPEGDLKSSQVGLRDLPGYSGAQVSRDAVGAWIRSSDLVNGAASSKFIITPTVDFKPALPAFDQDIDHGVNISFDLQVPVATDGLKPLSTTYVVSDFLVRDKTTGVSISINAIIFHNAAAPSGDFVFYDPPTAQPVAVGVISGRSNFLATGLDSQSFRNRPWRGWNHFSYTVAGRNLAAAIRAVKLKFPDVKVSENISNWELTQWHLNAELLFAAGPAEMGWSMQHLALTEAH